MKNIVFSDGLDLDVRLFIDFLECEYPIKIIKTGDIYNVYTLDDRLIFLTSKVSNVVDGLEILYSNKEGNNE